MLPRMVVHTDCRRNKLSKANFINWLQLVDIDYIVREMVDDKVTRHTKLIVNGKKYTVKGF